MPVVPMPEQELEKFVEKRFKKLIDKLEVPVQLHDDLRQELWVIAIETSSRYYNPENPFAEWRMSTVVDREATKYVKNEQTYSEVMEFIPGSESIDRSTRSYQMQLERLAIQKYIQELVGLSFSTLNEKEQLILQHIFDDSIYVDEDGYLIELKKILNVNHKERARQIYQKMLTRMRHPSRSRCLRDLISMFEEIEQKEKEIWE